MKGKIQALLLEEIVSKEIRLYTESFLEEEQTRRIEQRVRESICESLLERKKKLETEQQKNQISKIQCYERHKQGIMEKEEYLSKREFLTQRVKNVEQEISIIEDKIQENTVSRHHLNLDKLRETVAKGELVLEWINEVIDRIYVYDKDKVEIVWKFENEMED